MRFIFIIPLLISCSSIFVTESKLNDLWIGKNHTEIVDILGPYSRQLENLSNPGSKILIWEASKNNILIPIEKLGAKNKLGTSISYLHIYINQERLKTNIKKSVY